MIASATPAALIDSSAFIAALQIRADHQAEALTRLVKVIERLTVRIEVLESDRSEDPSAQAPR